MSRIGKLPIPVPSGVEVTISGRDVTVKGPKGTLSHSVVEPITISRSEDELVVVRPDDESDSKARHGLTRTLVANMVIGVTQGYSKTLEIVGTGNLVQARGSKLEIALGFSHPVTVTPPEGISFAVEAPTRFVVSGIDKQQVGETAANIRKIRKPEPYKG
jgi:large subunit ribosomal protein L6